MGCDKALVRFAGKTLVQNASDIFAAAGISAKIAGRPADLTQFEETIQAETIQAETIQDTFPNQGPMSGIHAALSASRCNWNLFLPVDMPLLPASLLRLLVDRTTQSNALISAVTLNGRLQPFPVLLHQDVLPSITSRLQTSQSSCHQAWQTVSAELASTLDAPSVESLVQCGCLAHPAGLPPIDWFRSANTPGDLAYLNRIHNYRASSSIAQSHPLI